MIPTISIAIPYHDASGTAFYLSRLFKSIAEQTFTDFEIVLTKEGSFARNHNAAILKSRGTYVQMMGIDDFFAHPNALQNIVDGFKSGKVWQITACLHLDGDVIGRPHLPQWTDDIYLGNNRLGGVSTLSFIREKGLLFEEPLTWVVDCDLYYRLKLRYGEPNLLTTHNVVIDIRNDRTTGLLSQELMIGEIEYLRSKYGK